MSIRRPPKLYDPGWDEQRVAAFIKELEKLYDKGKGVPVFTKRHIQIARDARDRGNQQVYAPFECNLMGIDENPATQRHFPVMEHLKPTTGRFFLQYQPIESILNEDRALGSRTAVPVWISRKQLDESMARMAPQQRVRIGQFVSDVRRTWQAAPGCSVFKTTVSSARFAGNVNKVIGFGLGPFTLEDDLHNRRAIVQHDMLSSLHDLVAHKSGGAPVGCFAQDPGYEAEERNILGSLNVLTADDPQGFLMLDDESVVMAIAPDVPVKQIVLDLCRPVAILWQADLAPQYRGEVPTDPTSERVKRILDKEYRLTRFPAIEGAHFPDGGNLELWVRKK